jgi:hypothetical protein
MNKRSRQSPQLLSPKTKRPMIKSRSPKSISSISSYDSSPLSRSSPNVDMNPQQDMAKVIKNLYMTVDINKAHRMFNKVRNNGNMLQKYRLTKETFEKRLVHPTTLINITTKLQNLEIASHSPKSPDASYDIYKTYASLKSHNYLISIFDTLGMKVLYLICHDDKYYLSPMNIRQLRDNIRKDLIDFDAIDITFLNICNQQLMAKFPTIEEEGRQHIHIDAKSYDIIMISQAFISFTQNADNIEVYIDTPIYHKSSMLVNSALDEDHEAHLISIAKCYNYNMVNTTWKPFNVFQIEHFTPGVEKYYNLNETHNHLEEVTWDAIEDIEQPDIYFSHYQVQEYMDVTLNRNIHFFTGKTFTAPVNGGSPFSMMIPEISSCADIYFPHNGNCFCWFSSIINSFFYADDISTICLQKSMKRMDKTLEYIKAFCEIDYKSFDIKNNRDVKKFVIHLIHLFTFIYCSFSMLSKKQINRIHNKQKWLDIYNRVTGDHYDYIYVFIIALSKIQSP